MYKHHIVRDPCLWRRYPAERWRDFYTFASLSVPAPRLVELWATWLQHEFCDCHELRGRTLRETLSMMKARRAPQSKHASALGHKYTARCTLVLKSEWDDMRHGKMSWYREWLQKWTLPFCINSASSASCTGTMMKVRNIKNMTKTRPSSLIGEKSPYPTVVAVTTEK